MHEHEDASLVCRVCGEAAPGERVELREMMYGTRERFAYRVCAICGSLQIEKVPPDLARHYPADYYSHAPRAEPAAPRGLKGVVARWYCRSAVLHPGRRWARALRRCLPEPGDFVDVRTWLERAGLQRHDEPILDVGCGSSPFRLAAMRRCGFTGGEGADPFAAADLVYHGVPVHRCAIGAVPGPGRYGLVMFHHSLEHVPEPHADLRAAAALLRPGGACLIRIPLMGSHFWQRFGVDWAELDAPRHLHLMTAKGLERMAGRAGLELRERWFDSTGWELAASLQYAVDVPLRDPRSYLSGGPQAMFGRADLKRFDAEAAVLNARGEGGRAAFLFVKR